jgi:uncharacterized membrane protein YbhN (UPF0104 family)
MAIKLRKSFLYTLKTGLFILICFAFYKQWSRINWDETIAIADIQWDFVLVALLLVFVNWGLEWLKWLFIVKNITVLPSRSVLVKSLLAGIATGFITPNRLGNFLGRILFFSKSKALYLTLGTLYGNLAQFIATIIFGWLGLYIIGNKLLSDNYSQSAVVVSTVVMSIAIIIYALGPFLYRLEWRRFKRMKNVLLKLSSMAEKTALPLLIFSMLRYLCFVTQFTLLILAFGGNYTHELIAGVYVVFLITTLTPNLLFGKLMIRESVALFVLGNFVFPLSTVLFASVTLWVINLGIPALIGFMVLLLNKYKLIRT